MSFSLPLLEKWEFCKHPCWMFLEIFLETTIYNSPLLYHFSESSYALKAKPVILISLSFISYSLSFWTGLLNHIPLLLPHRVKIINCTSFQMLLRCEGRFLSKKYTPKGWVSWGHSKILSKRDFRVVFVLSSSSSLTSLHLLFHWQRISLLLLWSEAWRSSVC